MGQTLRSWKPKRLVILSTRVQTWRYPNFTHAQLSTSTEARGLLHSENGSTPWQKNCRICTGFDQMFDIRSKYVSDLWPNDFRWNQESKQKWVVCIISLCVYVNVRIYMYIYIYVYIYITERNTQTYEESPRCGDLWSFISFVPKHPHFWCARLTSLEPTLTGRSPNQVGQRLNRGLGGLRWRGVRGPNRLSKFFLRPKNGAPNQSPH
jgi:hypothetical protein